MFEAQPQLQFEPASEGQSRRGYKTAKIERIALLANERRAAIKAAGGEPYEKLLAWERAKRKVYRARHRAKLREQKRSHRGLKPELVRRARLRGRKAGMAATITVADIHWPTHCPVLGIALDYDTPRGQRAFAPNLPSLDRWDNTKGYVPGNVFVISLRANSIKSSATYEELLRVARYAAKRPAAP